MLGMNSYIVGNVSYIKNIESEHALLFMVGNVFRQQSLEHSELQSGMLMLQKTEELPYLSVQPGVLCQQRPRCGL